MFNISKLGKLLLVLPIMGIFGLFFSSPEVEQISPQVTTNSSKTANTPPNSVRLEFAEPTTISDTKYVKYTFNDFALEEKVNDARQGYYWMWKNESQHNLGRNVTFVLDNILINKFGEFGLNILNEIRPKISSISANLAITGSDNVYFTSGIALNNFWGGFSNLQKLDLSGFNSLYDLDINTIVPTSPYPLAELYLSALNINRIQFAKAPFRLIHFNSSLRNNVETDINADIAPSFKFFLPYKTYINDNASNELYSIGGALENNVTYDSKESTSSTSLLWIFVTMGVIGAVIMSILGFSFRRNTK